MSVLFYDGVDHMIEKITTLIKGKANNSHKHTKNDITDFPTLGTASSKDVASSGNASATQVVMGNDTRLSDARKSSDVHDWAKASTKPSYTKSEVGLANVDNTSDTSKPVSTAQQTAIDAAYTNANKYTDKKVADLIGSAPETMDTLEEVAAAIQENKDVETALNEAIGKKVNQTELDTHTGNTTIHITASERKNWNAAKTHADSAHARTDATKVEKSTTNGNIKINGTETNVYTHPSGTNPHGTTKSDVGLGNVGNYKAVSTVASQGLSDTEKVNARANIGAQIAGSYASSSHNHDTVYSKLGHTHDDRYYTESEMNEKLGTKVDLSADGVSKAINQLTIGTDAPSDADYYVSQYATGGTTHTSYHRRPMSALWSYIKSKADKVYSALGHKHTKAEITDFPNSLPANGGNSDTVNGHTVESNVPANAKFTDTNTWRPQPDWNATSGDAVIKNKPASLPANGGDADHATRLVCAETRPTSANKASSSDRVGMMEMFIASSSMTTGKPTADAKILQMNWDNTSGWDSQLAMTNDGLLQHRNMSNGTWKDWKTVLDNNTGDWTPRMFDTASNEVRVGAAFGQYYVLGDMVFIDAILGIDGGCACHHISGLPYKPESNRPSNVYPIGIASSSKGTNSPFNHISGSDSWYVQNDAHASRDISDTWYVYGWYRKA